MPAAVTPPANEIVHVIGTVRRPRFRQQRENASIPARGEACHRGHGSWASPPVRTQLWDPCNLRVCRGQAQVCCSAQLLPGGPVPGIGVSGGGLAPGGAGVLGVPGQGVPQGRQYRAGQRRQPVWPTAAAATAAKGFAAPEAQGMTHLPISLRPLQLLSRP